MERVDVIKDICQKLNLTQIDNSWIKTLGQFLGVNQLPGNDDYEQRVFTEAISNSDVVFPTPNFGRFGIADPDGFYSYYPSLQDAIDDAISGQVVEVFTDYVEPNPVTITLKDGVIINGNGHSYTKIDDTTNGFYASGVTTSILNYNLNFNLVERVQNFAHGFELYDCNIDFNGSKIKSIDTTTSESTVIRVYNSTIKNLNIDATNAINGEGLLGDGNTTVINCSYNGNYDTFTNCGKVISCYCKSVNGGIFTSAGDVVNCVSYSNADAITADRIINSYGRSETANGLTSTNIYKSVQDNAGVITVF